MKSVIDLTIKPRLFALLVFGFVIATIVGTVSHELGHYVIMKRYGFNPTIHYASASYGYNEEYDKLRLYWNANLQKIKATKDSPEKKYFDKEIKKFDQKFFFITLGGPAQTMITGTAGIVLLWLYRKKLYNNGKLKALAWLAVFLAFFWSRQVFNFMMSLPFIFNERRSPYRSDEPKLSQYLDLPPWAFGMATAIVGAILLAWVILRVIPKQQRLSFIGAGLVGSALGWILWMDVLGPVLLP